ncbi:MAG: sigma-70 family RNA polymerase sigma factor, partial [Candidatus Omnitrophota bacterium]|nr:sigma-70 family RNA polymerase sigma factor [Candidatus Omnitrophota bacterium]
GLYNTFAMNENNDKELVKRCLEGSAEAWSEFVDRFSGLIYWAIKRKLNRYDCAYLIRDVEDIYQRIFVRLWEKESLLNVSGRDNISPWLIVLASNLTIDFIRKKNREENFLLTNAPEAENMSGDDETVIFSEENKRLLNNAVKLLDEKEKTYLKFNYFAGKKHREIAGIFNTSVNSVSTIIARAKNKIRKYIESKSKNI